MGGSLGLGVMIHMLAGNERSVRIWKAHVGKRIAALTIDAGNPALCFQFTDGSQMALKDVGQSCCEDRYMTSDDDLSAHIGAELLDAEIASAPSIPYEYGEHEVQFLRVQTSAGVLTVETHNKHNGYYGGFHISAVTGPYDESY